MGEKGFYFSAGHFCLATSPRRATSRGNLAPASGGHIHLCPAAGSSSLILGGAPRMCQTLQADGAWRGCHPLREVQMGRGAPGAGTGHQLGWQGLGDARGVLQGKFTFPSATAASPPGPARGVYLEEKGNGEKRSRRGKSVSLQARFLPRQGLRRPARFLSSGRVGFQVARDFAVSQLRGEITKPRSPRPGWWLNNSSGCRNSRCC